MRTNRQPTSAATIDVCLSDMTIAAEFIMTAMRAVANGHPAISTDVVRPLTWARTKIDEVLAQTATTPSSVIALSGGEG